LKTDINDLQELRLDKYNSIDLATVAAACGLEINKRGNKYQAYCPFHKDDKTQSFRIYSDTNTWSCFSSVCRNPHSNKRNGGGVIEFVRQYKKISFFEAIEWLEENFIGHVLEIKEQPKERKTTKISSSIVLYCYNLLMSDNSNYQWFLDRGLTRETITSEALGFDGENHIIPVWEAEPRTSRCICIKSRTHSGQAKYIRLGSYEPYLYNLHTCQDSETVFGFAGELDALLASQYGLAAFSTINGSLGFEELDPNWPNIYFPNAKKLVAVFDRKEATAGATMCGAWQKIKGRFTANNFMWPYFGGDDFTDYIKAFSFVEFMKMIGGLL